MPTLRELTAQFWAAAIYVRRAAPDAPSQGHAQKILRRVATAAPSPLKERAAELMRDHDEPTRYDH